MPTGRWRNSIPVEHGILWLGLTELRAHPEIPREGRHHRGRPAGEGVRRARTGIATSTPCSTRLAPKLRPRGLTTERSRSVDERTLISTFFDRRRAGRGRRGRRDRSGSATTQRCCGLEPGFDLVVATDSIAEGTHFPRGHSRRRGRPPLPGREPERPGRHGRRAAVVLAGAVAARSRTPAWVGEFSRGPLRARGPLRRGAGRRRHRARAAGRDGDDPRPRPARARRPAQRRPARRRHLGHGTSRRCGGRPAAAAGAARRCGGHSACASAFSIRSPGCAKGSRWPVSPRPCWTFPMAWTTISASCSSPAASAPSWMPGACRSAPSCGASVAAEAVECALTGGDDYELCFTVPLVGRSAPAGAGGALVRAASRASAPSSRARMCAGVCTASPLPFLTRRSGTSDDGTVTAAP